MQFKYELSGHGWAEGFIEVDSKKISFSPGYVTDAFGDLLRGLTDLLNGEERVVTFLWEEEPIGLNWRLKLQGSMELSLTITEYEDTSDYIEGKEGVIIVDTTCDFLDFVKMIIKESDQLLFRHGIVGYHKMWSEHEFPLSSYLQLKYALTEEEQSKDCEKNEFKKELQFLTRNFS
ncbi:TPA: hypothetical protein ROX88_002446 [Bacillus pseudomycoides]|nr:hypothetical protein [Bacillus pseudomycoides]